MFDAETIAMLHLGAPIIMGTVSADGEPLCGRAWGIDVEPGATELRVFLDASDEPALRNIEATGRIALTASDVADCTAIQIKGRATAVVPASRDDRVLIDRHCEAFFGEVGRVDGTPRAMLERLVPAAFLACAVQVDELYDQTPGPTAGTALVAAAE